MAHGDFWLTLGVQRGPAMLQILGSICQLGEPSCGARARMLLIVIHGNIRQSREIIRASGLINVCAGGALSRCGATLQLFSAQFVMDAN